MSDILYFNGHFTTTAARVLTVEDRGFQFGDAVYEVIKFRGRRLIFPDEHFLRLSRCLGDLEITNPFDLPRFRKVVDELLSRTEFDDGIIYVQISRGEAERSHFWPEDLPPTVVMYTRQFNFPDMEKQARGIRVITVPELRSRLSYIKSVNLLGNAVAKKKAQRAGADEALFILDGHVVEGASSSFFAVLDGRVVTTPLSEDLLPGVTRELVVSLALSASIPVEFGRVSVGELSRLDEAFITSTTQGVMPVVSIDGERVADGHRGAITLRLQQLLVTAEGELPV